MAAKKVVIVGCGDIGKRLVLLLRENGYQAENISVIVKSQKSRVQCESLGLQAVQLDFDDLDLLPESIQGADLFYLVPPQKQGVNDCRSRKFIQCLVNQELTPNKVVLISTTGVYGDNQGEWVTEQTPAKPIADRAKRRLDAELQWQQQSTSDNFGLTILRVASIYSNSRIPRQRIENSEPIVIADECGYSNRIHVADLANVLIAVLDDGANGEVFNISDGVPGKISDYLQEAASVVGAKPLTEITMQEAKEALSDGMLSYLCESRKISNTKMLDKLKVTLRYPDFRLGLRH